MGSLCAAGKGGAVGTWGMGQGHGRKGTWGRGNGAHICRHVAKLIFVVFVFDMSVALMNLVLGLAVSDIDELQRNSAVRRMIQESYTVMYIDGFMTWFANLSSCVQ